MTILRVQASIPTTGLVFPQPLPGFWVSLEALEEQYGTF